ncbi:YebO family protein [Buttiauxella brennerae]|uniref:YebO family protein n=1 Tax=Buttiauxella brennerae TaxID=82988 RepID=UPI00286F8FC6|nr:YebO family protein [Buttiauxella brennerae]
MNELSVGALNIVSLTVSLVVLVIGLVMWFFVNRASSRTNDQIELLEELLDQQKRQNALLRRLCEANEPEAAKEESVEIKKEEEEVDDFSRLVAER